MNARILSLKVKRNTLNITQTPGIFPLFFDRLRSYPPQLPRWHEQDASELQAACDSVIERAITKLEEAGYTRSSVKVIGVTNQRETTVVWSRKTGKPLARAIVWDDSRTRGIVKHFENLLESQGIEIDGKVRRGKDGALGIKELTGLPLSTYFSAIKLRWMLDHWEDVRKAHEEDDLAFGTVESWIAYNLLGGVTAGRHISEVTNASRTLLLNIRTLQWDPALLRFFGIRDSVLPRLVSTSEVYGEIAYGPLKGVPLGGLVGDQQGALIGNKCLAQGQAKCTYGTGAFLLFCTGRKFTVAYQAGPHSKPVYALEGAIAVAGSSIKWLRDSMGLIKSANEINTLAASVPSTSGVYFVTAFSGLLAPYWDSAATGLLIGLTSYTTPAHIARATLEAIAYQTRAVIKSMTLDAQSDLTHLKVDGGMTNGDLAMGVLADVGGFEVVRPEMRESTALGSALLAGSAIGLFGWDISRPETLMEVNTARSTSFNPRTTKQQRLEAYIGWQRAVERSRGWFETTAE
ncbi:glycerol kinase [Lactarius quietus]|nr:glycerol kinase [Lactarius quietus]